MYTLVEFAKNNLSDLGQGGGLKPPKPPPPGFAPAGMSLLLVAVQCALSL